MSTVKGQLMWIAAGFAAALLIVADGLDLLFDPAPVIWLQAAASQPLTWVMNAISLLGYTRVYLAFAVILACSAGIRAGAALLVIIALNAVVIDGAKTLAGLPRPDGVDPRVQTLSVIDTIVAPFRADAPASNEMPVASIDADDSYGFPSGHVAAATALLVGIRYLFGWTWAWRVGAVWVPAMALSRMYLGRHFLGDVVGGACLGGLGALVALGILTPRSRPPLSHRAASVRLLGVAAVCLVPALVAGTPAPYDVGRFLGFAAGAAAIGAPDAARFDGARVGSRAAAAALAALTFAAAWLSMSATLGVLDLSDTRIGHVVAGAVPAALLLAVPLSVMTRVRVHRLRAGRLKA